MKYLSLIRAIITRLLTVISITAISALALVLCWSPGSASAATTQSSNAATAPSSSITLSVSQSSSSSNSLKLTSQVASNAQIKGQQVSFFVVTKEFTKTSLDVPIGSATTGSNGTASITYKPTWTGNQDFVAKLTTTGTKTAVTATASYDVLATTPGPLYSASNPARPLSRVGHFFVGSALAIVAIVWLTLITFLILAKARLPRLAGDSHTD